MSGQMQKWSRKQTPGDFLRMHMDRDGLGYNRLGEIVSYDSSGLCHMVKGRRPIPKDMCPKLDKQFGLVRGTFLAMQEDWKQRQQKKTK